MNYLSADEKEAVQWFTELQAEGKTRCEAMKLDPLGYLILCLPEAAPAEDVAWLAYVAAQAKGKKAAVNFHALGCLVLVLPRYELVSQETLPLPGD